MKRLNHLVVVGGGTAGWITACYLIDRIRPDIKTKITLIESKDIPIIGVGESTTPQLRNFVRNIHFLQDDEEFLKESNATFKYGIVHSDWHTVGKSFVSPLGGEFKNDTRYPHERYDYIRNYHIAEGLDYRYVYQARCMLESKVFYVKGEKDNPFPDTIYEEGYTFLDTTDAAYHIDAYLTSDYLRRKALATGKIERVEDTIVETVRDQQGYIESLKLKSGETIEGDLFFDATGFARVLKADDNKFVSYSDQLLLDSAIVFPKSIPQDEEIRTYTHAKALKQGWMFEIPLQDRMGRGYNFSSQFTDADTVASEVSEMLDEDIEVRNVLSYEPGRMERFWDRNVIHVGISSGFLEPLEATTIHATLKQVEHFLEMYYSNMIDVRNEPLKQQYNRDMVYFYDDLRDFILYHYQNTRQDTEFWRESSKPERLSDKLARNMEMWKTRTPRLQDFSDGPMINFLGLGNALWYQIAMGMFTIDRNLAREELEYYGLTQKAKEDLQTAIATADYLAPRSMPSNVFYQKLRDSDF